MNELTHLDLFSGIGGMSLGFEAAGFRTIGFCECDPDRQRDLRHHWPEVPIIGDVNDLDSICRVVEDSSGCGRYTGCSSVPGPEGRRTFTGNTKRKPLVLSAGVPCQPASAAGKRKASADDRWLWPQTIRVVERVLPDWIVFENPLGIASLAEPAAIPGVDVERLRGVAGRTVCEILTAIKFLGYELPTDLEGHPWIPVVPAAGVGAFHGRDRLWIIARRRDVANTTSTTSPRQREHGRNGFSVTESELDQQAGIESCVPVGKSSEFRWGKRIEQESMQEQSEATTIIGAQPPKTGILPNWSDAILEQGNDEVWRAVKPGLHLLANGIPRRTSKLRGFGNSAVPQVVYQIAQAIKEQILRVDEMTTQS